VAGQALRGGHEGGNQLGRVLAVRIHGQRVREAGGGSLADAFEHGGALAAVFRQNDDVQAGIFAGQGL